MKIIKVEPYLLMDKMEDPFYFSQFQYDQRKICIVRITTDDGTEGWGEGYGPGHVVKAGIEQITPYLINRDPLHHENIWQDVYRHIYDYSRKGIFLSALSAIDIALWDLKGKILQQPVSILLGGRKREKIRVYATGLYFTNNGEMTKKLATEALAYKTENYTAIKMKVGLGIDQDVKNVTAVRKAIGPEVQLMIDANHAFDLREAKQLIEKVQDQDITWFEEPVSNDDYDSYAELRRWSSIPIAGGECEYLKFGALEMLSKRCVDVFQPDTGACGGITEVKKMMAIAEAFTTNLTPHTWGTGIAIAANLHLVSNLNVVPQRLCSKEPMMEFDRSPNRLREDLLVDKFIAKAGYIDVPDDYGLGIEINEEKLNLFKV